MIKLYRKNALGLGTWRIWAEGAKLIYCHAVVENGAEILHSDTVELNASGRNLEQQVELEMDSRVSRMLDKGYKYSRDEALAGATNQLGLINPMLAQSLSKLTKPPAFTRAHVQPKLDGHRCLITNMDGHILAYTRKGKPITTVNHILQEYSHLPEGMTVDGELYIHGMKLQGISSLIKREQAGSAKLRFHWYDYVSQLTFEERYANMVKFCVKYEMQHTDLVETLPVGSMADVMEHFGLYRKAGYEGLMLRLSIAGYEDNVRAYQLLKVKEREDIEVTVIGARPSKDGWAVLTVQMDNGKTFETSAPGSVPEKTEVLHNFEKYRGRKLTVEYAMLTEDGIPFHAVAIRWHEEL